MAKENTIYLHGQVAAKPRLYYGPDGSFKKATIEVNIVRRPGPLQDGQPTGGGKLRIDTPTVSTGNEEIGKKMGELQINDMVDVKGVLTTREAIKTTPCERCGHKNSVMGSAGYVTAIYICRRETGIGEEKGLELLLERSGISNSAILIGTLCREPKTYESDDGKTVITQYQLASNRKYHIRDDGGSSNKTDYPWVKTFGTQAKEDALCLSINSTVLINGAIQTRGFKRTTICESCDGEYEWNDKTIEVVPYSVEYLANCYPIERVKPRENTIHLHGQVMSPPKVRVDSEGNAVKTTFAMKVLRRPYIRANGQISGGRLRIDALIVSTTGEKTAETASALRQFDMVDVKGALTIQETAKPAACNSCGHANSVMGSFGFVTATYVCGRETGLDEEEGMSLLHERSEISNTAIIAGGLCHAPEPCGAEGNRAAVEYQLEASRKKRNSADEETPPADRPWVKSIGKQAMDDTIYLTEGSTVLVNGAVQARESSQTAICENCGEEFGWDEKTVELFPHSVEYLLDCLFPDSGDETNEDGESDDYVTGAGVVDD